MEFKSVLDIPAPYCNLFEHFDSFNQLQSALFNDILHSNKSVVLSAPTGSGKTVAFELAIVRMLMDAERCKNSASEPGEEQNKLPVALKPKAVYVAPMKALCTEKFNEWNTRFGTLGVNCVKITGDSDYAEIRTLREAQLIITTPEKWNMLSRNAVTRECAEILNDMRLFMVDEVHLLNEDIRGPILEVIMSRMKRLRMNCVGTLRLIVASATIPNAEDFTLWIGHGEREGISSAGGETAEVTQLVYLDNQRPVPLRRHVIGIQSKRTGFKFDIGLNYKLVDIILKYSENKSTLIFCNSRKSTEMAAAVINEDRRLMTKDTNKREFFIKLSQSDAKLCRYVKNSIAFHHAGVSSEERGLIEENFRNGSIKILLCTNTLAMGVNLPAHLVIIKSTQSYAYGSLIEYPESTLLQMIGRAGRPQYDVNCTSVVLTEKKNLRKYSNLINGKMPIESHLHKHLTEHLNAEIAYQSVKNFKMALEWIQSTYFYIRLIKNPIFYGLPEHATKEKIEKTLEKQCLVEIERLENLGLISKSFTGEINLEATAYGKLMATFSVSYETLKIFQNVYDVESLYEIVTLITSCNELSQFTLRTNEKQQLNELNKKLRFPIRKRITTREEKILCIIQAALGNLEISLPSLSQESSKIICICKRLANCLVAFIHIRVSENEANGLNSDCYKALLYAVTISKCFHAKMWENSEYVSKQLRKICAAYSSALVNAGKTTLKSISETPAETLELLLSESHPFGVEVLENLNSFPSYSIQINLRANNQVQIYVKQTNSGYVSTGADAALIVGDTSNALLHYNSCIASILQEFGFLDQSVSIPNKNVNKIFAHIVHNTIVGVDVCQFVVINELTVGSTSSNIQYINGDRQSNLNTRKRQRNSIQTKNPLIKGSKLNLHNFTFSKSKLVDSGANVCGKDTSNEDTISDELDSLHITKGKVDMKQNNFHNETTKTTSATTLVQAKLTKFFNLKKFPVKNLKISNISKTDAVPVPHNMNINAKPNQEIICKNNTNNIEGIHSIEVLKRIDNVRKNMGLEAPEKSISNNKNLVIGTKKGTFFEPLNLQVTERQENAPRIEKKYHPDSRTDLQSSPLDLSIKKKTNSSGNSGKISSSITTNNVHNSIYRENLRPPAVIHSVGRRSTTIARNEHQGIYNPHTGNAPRNQLKRSRELTGHSRISHEKEHQNSLDANCYSTSSKNRFRLQISRNFDNGTKDSFNDSATIRKINDDILTFVLDRKIKMCPTNSGCENIPEQTEDEESLESAEFQSIIDNKYHEEKFEELKKIYLQMYK